MPLELPAKDTDPPQPDSYNTLGQFYAAIAQGIEYLDGEGGLWDDSRADLQYVRGYWNEDGGGEEFPVTDLDSARKAITTIVEQGEGAGGTPDVPIYPDDPTPGDVELSHYARFKAIADGIEPIEQVWPLPTNPKTSDFQDDVKELATFFNAAYCFVLCMIDALYETSGANMKANETNYRYGLERKFIAAMGGLLYPIAELLVTRSLHELNLNAAPTFEYHEFEDESPLAELVRRCDALLGPFPQLGGDDGVRALLGRMPDVRPQAAPA